MWNDNWLCLTSVYYNYSSSMGMPFPQGAEHSQWFKGARILLLLHSTSNFLIVQLCTIEVHFKSILLQVPCDDGFNRLVAVGTVYIVQVLMDAILHQNRGYHYVILQKICNKQASKEKKSNEVTCPYTNYEMNKATTVIYTKKDAYVVSD